MDVVSPGALYGLGVLMVVVSSASVYGTESPESFDFPCFCHSLVTLCLVSCVKSLLLLQRPISINCNVIKSALTLISVFLGDGSAVRRLRVYYVLLLE